MSTSLPTSENPRARLAADAARRPQSAKLRLERFNRPETSAQSDAGTLGQSAEADALQGIERASHSVAIRAVLVHALDEKAAAFYTRYGFKPASAEPLTLMVPLEAVRRTLSV